MALQQVFLQAWALRAFPREQASRRASLQQQVEQASQERAQAFLQGLAQQVWRVAQRQAFPSELVQQVVEPRVPVEGMAALVEEALRLPEQVEARARQELDSVKVQECSSLGLASADKSLPLGNSSGATSDVRPKRYLPA